MAEITAPSARKLSALRRPLLSMSPDEALAFTEQLRARRRRPQAALKISTRKPKAAV